MTDRSNKSAPTVKSVGRVFEVLESFKKVGRPLALKQVAAQLQYPSSSTHALLRSMTTLGYLAYDSSTHMYFPTLRVTHLGDWIERTALGERVLDAMVVSLQRLTRETVAVSIENDTRMQFVHIAHSDQPLRLDLVPGESVSITHSAIGAALLSTKPPAEIRRLIHRANALEQNQDAHVDPAVAVKDAARIRRAGFVIAYNQVIEGTGAIAMPLPSTRTGSGIVLAVAGPESRVRAAERKIIEHMRTTISQHLGRLRDADGTTPASKSARPTDRRALSVASFDAEAGLRPRTRPAHTTLTNRKR